MKKIISADNEKIKTVASLQNKKGRDATGLFAAEGVNILKGAGVEPKYVFVSEERKDLFDFAESLGGECFEVSSRVFSKISATKTSQGLIAAFAARDIKVAESVGIYAVLDGLSDPGNVGAVIRTCAALGVSEVFCVGCADAYSDKAVRASMGGIFKVNITVCGYDGLKEALLGRKLFALDMRGGSIFDTVPNGKFAVAVGSEARGISADLRAMADETVSLPMSGNMESLNAAVSMSVALYVLKYSKI